jgi:diguanylate cyclase (GGDEF)-like protein
MSATEQQAENVYVELVRSLFANIMPSIIMWMVFGATFALIYRIEADPLLFALGCAGLLINTVRLVVTVALRGRALTAALRRSDARILELAFGLPYFGFSLLLGLFGAHVFQLASAEAHMLTICVLVGYCAGVATGAGLRPNIAIPSMAVAIGPAIVVASFRGDPIYLGMGVIALGFLLGGSQSVLVRHRVTRAEISKRITSVSLARCDTLTALPNRLALKEYFEDNASAISPNGLIAVHYLDLNGFKPVNDSYGHAVGDALLTAVANRLRGAIRNGDIVARLGGDEFAVIQFGLNRAEEAELLSRRISATIAQPFEIGDRTVSISTCIGTAISNDRGQKLDLLLREADEKLYALKRARAARDLMLNIA